MRTLLILITLVLFSPIANSQGFHLRTGIGANIAGEESSITHSYESLILFLEAGTSTGNNFVFRYRLEAGVKIQGMETNDTDPPQKYGSNFVLNQYLKGLKYLGDPESNNRAFVGLGYLMHYQRPYITYLDQNDAIISTERVNRFGHGLGIHTGIDISRFTIEGSFYYVSSRFNNFGSINLGYRLWK